MRRLLVTVLLVVGLAGLSPAAGAALPDGFVDEAVATIPRPTAFAFLPDGRALVTSQTGQLHLVDGGSPRVVLDLGGQLCTNSERGLLGVAVDPGFAQSRRVYLYLTRSAGGSCSNQIVRYQLGPDDVPVSPTPLVTGIASPNGNHNGGDLGFGRDGALYAAVGDGGPGGQNARARSRSLLNGKILRLDPDGGIPPGNPFASGADCSRGPVASGVCREIFATGLRNPFRMAFDPNVAGTRFFLNDVGQNAWEEVDEARAGADYGWNICEGTHDNPDSTENGNCERDPFTPPVHEYPHEGGCVSITGGAFVPRGLWPAEYDGDYLYADFGCGTIFRLAGDGSGPRTTFLDGLGPVVSLGFGPAEGGQALYYTTFAEGATLRRIRYVGDGNRPPTAALAATPPSGPSPLDVALDASASADPDGDALRYAFDPGDGSPVIETDQPRAAHTYRRAGAFVASVVVTDARGAASVPATVRVDPGNTAPVASIGDGAGTYEVGERLTVAGGGTDAEDGELAGSALSWTVTLHHAEHTHPLVPPTPGAELSFVAPPPEDLAAVATTWLEVTLTATDSSGVAATATRRLDPRRVEVTLATDPPGLRVRVNGADLTAPATVTSVQCYPLDVGAPDQRTGDGTPYELASWSDGGAAEHRVLTDAGGGALTATFRVGGDGAEEQGAGGPTIERVGGADRVATAVALSARRFPSCGTPGGARSETVVLARADAYADALAGSSLAFARGAPLLLTASGELSAAARAEIDRLGATRAVLLGGPDALSPALEAAVGELGLTVERLAGRDRFETAGLVAGALPPGQEAYLVEGSSADPRRGWPDAVNASWLAARRGAPILLTTRAELPAATAAALAGRGVERLTVVGGAAAVSDAVAGSAEALGATVERVGGANRYETARALADRAGTVDGLTVFLTTGEDYADTLAAGPAVAARAGVLLPIDGRDLRASPATADWLARNRGAVAGAVLVGGPAAIAPEVEADVRLLLAGRT